MFIPNRRNIEDLEDFYTTMSNHVELATTSTNQRHYKAYKGTSVLVRSVEETDEQVMKDMHTSKNQSYSAKKSGRPNKSETAPSAIGIDPRFPPFNKLVRRLLALSSKFLLVLGSST